MVTEENKQVSGTIKCLANIVAIRAPNVNEVAHIGNTLIMVLEFSRDGIQIGNFIFPYNPRLEIGSAFEVVVNLKKIDREAFIEKHGFTKINDSMERFIV